MTDVEMIERLIKLLEKARTGDLKLTLAPREGSPGLEMALRSAAQALKILDVIEKTREPVTLTPIDAIDTSESGFTWSVACDRTKSLALHERIACSGAGLTDALGQLTLVLALNSEE